MIKFSRKRVAEILEIGHAQDPSSRIIDVFIVILIFLNVIAIALESVPNLLAAYQAEFIAFETFSVIFFSIEYLMRVWSAIELDDVNSKTPIVSRIKYMLRPLVLIDLLAILPFYLAFFVSLDLRFLRVLRLLRIFKLTRYSSAMSTMLGVLREEASALSAAAFILFILLVLASSGIYLLEHKVQPEAFGSIPSAMWWSMITLTTVGYGDVVPVTAMGKVFGATIALIGVGMVALPTGILASGFANAFRRRRLSFEQEIDFALEDGELTYEESLTLQKLQDELGLSGEDAEHILKISLQRLKHEKHHCPKCGHISKPNFDL
jgi:voltage-gated potassium channel